MAVLSVELIFSFTVNCAIALALCKKAASVNLIYPELGALAYMMGEVISNLRRVLSLFAGVF